MRRNCRSWRIIAGFSLVLATLCLFQTRYALAQTQEPPKQTPEVEELKQRLQQLEQTVLELKGQINAIEDAKKQSPARAVIEATYSEPAAATTAAAPPAKPQNSQGESTFEIYGFAMLDAGYQFKQNDPDWFDVVGPRSCRRFRMSLHRMAILTLVSDRAVWVLSPQPQPNTVN